MAGRRLTFFLDVDNTLIDNDAAKAELGQRLAALLGAAAAARFWETYEAVRADTGVVNIPLTLLRFHQAAAAAGGAPALADRSALAGIFTLFPYRRFLFPAALTVIASLQRRGQVTILSDGDPVFQARKIWRAGLADAVEGAVMVFDQKTAHLAEAAAFYPADHYVIIDDKPTILRQARAVLGNEVTTVQVAHGHYARREPGAAAAAIDITVAAIGEVADHFGAAPHARRPAAERGT